MPEVESSLTRVLRDGVLRVAVEWKDPEATGFPPEMYLDPETGEPWGIIPILSRLITEDLGVALDLLELPWPEHVDALCEGRTDLLFNTNTPQRGLRIDYVRGRLMANRVFCLVPAGTPETDPAALDRPGAVISHWHGSSIGDIVRRHFPRATPLESAAPYEEVTAGRADACINDSITHRFLELNPGLQLMRDETGGHVVLSREYVHIGVRAGDTRFLHWLDNWHDYHHAQGTIQRWCDEWWESFMADRPAGQAEQPPGTELHEDKESPT